MDKQLAERTSALSYGYHVSTPQVKFTIDPSSCATNFLWDYSEPKVPNGFRSSFTIVNRRKITKHKKRAKKHRRMSCL